jgi:hypothetical protein
LGLLQTASAILPLLSATLGRVAVVTCMLVEQAFSVLVVLTKLVKVARYRSSRPAVDAGSSLGNSKKHAVKPTQQIYRLQPHSLL